MTRVTHVTLDWADGSYLFRLPIAQLEEHDEGCGAGPLTVLNRLADGSWRVPDVRETIRLGLIGGGTPAAEARKLVRWHVDAVPLIQSVPVAMVVLAAALRGDTAAPAPRDGAAAPGNDAAAEPATEPASTGSTSPPSDAPPSR